MRQVRKDSSGNGVQGGFPKEGMTEGPVKGWRRFSGEEISYIKRRRAELILEGKKDWAIARILALETGRDQGSVNTRISAFVSSREFERNPNEQKEFSKEEIAYIRKRRAELILEGKKDRQIATVLAGEIKRPVNSIRTKIYGLIGSGGFEENLNAIHNYGEEEVARMKRRRAELILEGKKDKQIATVLAGEMKRPVSSMCGKIRRLVESGGFEKNPNKINEFSEEEVAHIKKRRAELILEGKNDFQITRVLAGEMDRPAGSILDRIINLVESGGFEKNPNKQSDFSEEEVAHIKKRRAELILEGKKDKRIARIVSGEMKRTANSIASMIVRLIRERELGPNPNATESRQFRKEDIDYLKKRRGELVLEGKKDWQMARILAGEMNRHASSIMWKFGKLVERRELPENPNKKGREISEGELAAELSAAVNLYLGDSS